MKLTDFEIPVGGSKGNLFNVGDWWGLILGGVVLAIVIGMGVTIYRAVSARVPFLQRYDFEPFASPAAPAPAPVPQKTLYGVR